MKTKKNVGLTRQKADELLATLRSRIEQVNEDPQYLWGVYRVSVFGSYLTDKPKLGDLDVAIEIGQKCRNEKEHWERSQRQGREECTLRTPYADIFWSRTKTMRALRGRNYGFSFHDYWDLDGLIEQGAKTQEIYRNEQFIPMKRAQGA